MKLSLPARKQYLWVGKVYEEARSGKFVKSVLTSCIYTYSISSFYLVRLSKDHKFIILKICYNYLKTWLFMKILDFINLESRTEFRYNSESCTKRISMHFREPVHQRNVYFFNSYFEYQFVWIFYSFFNIFTLLYVWYCVNVVFF